MPRIGFLRCAKFPHDTIRDRGNEILLDTSRKIIAYVTLGIPYALENSAWQFVLKQKPESIDFAINQKWISDDDLLADMLKSVNSDSASGFSEIFIRGEHGQGVYRFMTDRHSYWMYTSNGNDIRQLAQVQHETGCTLMEAVDFLARKDYKDRGHPFVPAEGELLPKFIAKLQDGAT